MNWGSGCGGGGGGGAGGGAGAAKAAASVDAALKKLSSYRAGGDGKKAISTAAKMIANLVKKPDEPKFRRINLDNAGFKKRVSCLRGGVELFRAVGFKKVEQGGERHLVLGDDAYDAARLNAAVAAAQAAAAAL